MEERITEILDIEDPKEETQDGEKIHWITVEGHGKRRKLSMTLETMYDLKIQIDEYMKTVDDDAIVDLLKVEL